MTNWDTLVQILTHNSHNKYGFQAIEQVRIFLLTLLQGNPVADGWAGAVMRKPRAILETFVTDQPTDTARCRVACHVRD